MIHIKKFAKRELVFITALSLTLLSILLVPIDQYYLNYIDYKTLSSLFLMLLVLAGLSRLQVFHYLSTQLIKHLKNTQALVAALIFITFFFSLFIANDMALLTFLPLALITLKEAEKEEYLIFTIIMQNIAANLGGMLTPFGNPQNLYLYTYFSIPTLEFLQIMFWPFLFAILLISIFCLFIPKTPIRLSQKPPLFVDWPRIIRYLLLGIVVVLSIFRILDYRIVSIILLLYFIVFDRKSLLQIDYFLLLTFACFFIFSGNFARIELINTLASRLMEWNTYITAILSCQIMSNVPTAIFLSKFTVDYHDLLLAVNIGGVGTLISSLASLISFRIYTRTYTKTTKKYLLNFALLNGLFLLILATITYFIT